MSEENKVVEINEKDLAKVTGGNDYLPGSGWYAMYTSSMREIQGSSPYPAYKRIDSGEKFYVSSVSNNGIAGSMPVSTTYYFKSDSSSASFSFTAVKNGANICYDIE